MTVIAPPFSYFGGKTILAPQIVSLFPPHSHYVEPFGGGLSVLLAKPPARFETVNDLDHRLMTFWRVLRDRPAELERVCAFTPHSRAEYQHCSNIGDDPLGDDLEIARRVWVRISQGRTGTQRNTGWRHHVLPSGRNVPMPDCLEAYRDRMVVVADRLRHVSLECRPALDVITRYGDAAGVVLYVDPPYIRSTRTGGSNYLVDMGSEGDHRALAGALLACKASVILSGYDDPAYLEMYAGWHRRAFRSMTNGRVDGVQTARTEVLWSNRPFAQTDLFAEAGI